MDWRTEASQQAQDDLDALLQDSIAMAAELLSDIGSFAPFMLTVDHHSGKSLRRLQATEGQADQAQISANLTLADDAAQLRARATVCDVTAHGPISGDAIQVAVEHREGIAIDLLVPYLIDTDTVRIDMNSANAAVGVRLLWPTPPTR